MARHLFIVSRHSPDLYSYLAREFSSEADVQVILDRRQGDRRQRSERRSAARSDRRRTERRLKVEIGSQLATLGYAFVRLT